jgi:hypothetical protein
LKQATPFLKAFLEAIFSPWSEKFSYGEETLIPGKNTPSR